MPRKERTGNANLASVGPIIKPVPNAMTMVAIMVATNTRISLLIEKWKTREV
jgi:hypothetical protein